MKTEPARPRLFGLFVGISDYSRAARGPNGKILWDNLFFAAEDARALADLWQYQGRTPLYKDSLTEKLLEDAATRETVLERLNKLSDKVRPDDVFVLFLAGHGYAKRIRKNVFQPRTFVFAGPTFDVSNSKETGVAGDDLYQTLASLPCRKVLLLDCCHSGSTNVLRELAPEGIGPVMVAACRPHESSYDISFLGHGAFSNAILEALDEEFEKADDDKDARISVSELVSYVGERVPRTIELAKPVLGDDAVQTPQAFLPERLPIRILATQTSR